MKTVTINEKEITAYDSMAEMLTSELKHEFRKYGGAIHESQIVMQIDLNQVYSCFETTDRKVVVDDIEYNQFRFRTGEFRVVEQVEFSYKISEPVLRLVFVKSSAVRDVMHCVYDVTSDDHSSLCTFKQALESYDGEVKYTHPY